MLYELTGVLVWPFGPIDRCPTYSKCWFGLLTCGEPKVDNLKNLRTEEILKVLQSHQKDAVLPHMHKWSMRALYVHMRIMGAEIVVPDQKYVAVESETGEFDDVIIAQYSITLPYEKPYTLELRQDELYPATLYDWTDEQRYLLGMPAAGNIYLGSNEERCRAFTRCALKNILPECEKQSYVTGTPVAVAVADGSNACPGVRNTPLPLCPIMKSTEPGRWIQGLSSMVKPGCGPNVPFKTPIVYNASGPRGQWFEASGDPCVVYNFDNEEEGTGRWFYAPYRCKYHIYSKESVHQCFKNKSITHLQVCLVSSHKAHIFVDIRLFYAATNGYSFLPMGDMQGS